MGGCCIARPVRHSRGGDGAWIAAGLQSHETPAHCPVAVNAGGVRAHVRDADRGGALRPPVQGAVLCGCPAARRRAASCARCATKAAPISPPPLAPARPGSHRRAGDRPAERRGVRRRLAHQALDRRVRRAPHRAAHLGPALLRVQRPADPARHRGKPVQRRGAGGGAAGVLGGLAVPAGRRGLGLALRSMHAACGGPALPGGSLPSTPLEQTSPGSCCCAGRGGGTGGGGALPRGGGCQGVHGGGGYRRGHRHPAGAHAGSGRAAPCRPGLAARLGQRLRWAAAWAAGGAELASSPKGQRWRHACPRRCIVQGVEHLSLDTLLPPPMFLQTPTRRRCWPT